MHRRIIQTALCRGINTVGKTPNQTSNASSAPDNATFYDNKSNLYYQNSSSSSEENDKVDQAKNVKFMVKHNTNQVGGVSSSKRPVLTLEPHFILKPLRLSNTTARVSKHNNNTGTEDHPKDTTKIYRGVREIAFYEHLQSASALPSLDNLVSELGLLLCDDFSGGCTLSLSLLRLFSFSDTSNDIVSIVSDIVTGESNSAIVPDSHQLQTLAAYRTGDPITISTIKSCATSWYYFIKELSELKSLIAFTAPYSGLIDILNTNETDYRAFFTSQEMFTTLHQPHLILRDLAASFEHPNIIDIKMGTQTFEQGAPHPKQVREIKKYPLQSEFGFRIVGMRIYNPTTCKYKYWDKSFGTRLLTRDDCKNALKLFFQYKSINTGKSNSHHILSHIITKLSQIRLWFRENNRSLAFFASSILMVYEDSAYLGDHSNNEPMLKMIDFAHVCRKEGGDHGYLKGVENLLSILLEIMNENAQCIR